MNWQARYQDLKRMYSAPRSLPPPDMITNDFLNLVARCEELESSLEQILLPKVYTDTSEPMPDAEVADLIDHIARSALNRQESVG